MPFSKTKYVPTLTFAVTHEDYPGEEFIFIFPKVLIKAAQDEEQKYIGLPDEEREEVKREHLVKTIGNMLIRDPTNFEDFPNDDRPLAERMLEYYHSIEEEGLKKAFTEILGSAWLRYRSGRIPQVYLRRDQDSGSPNGLLRTAAV